MPNIVIYYHQQKNDTVEESIKRVDKIIKSMETCHTVKGVFLDSYNERNQLNDLLNSPLKDIDILFTNHFFDDEFDSQLINQLAKAEQFDVEFLDEI